VELCQPGYNSRNLILLGEYCAPEMPGARYLHPSITTTIQITVS